MPTRNGGASGSIKSDISDKEYSRYNDLAKSQAETVKFLQKRYEDTENRLKPSDKTTDKLNTIQSAIDKAEAKFLNSIKKRNEVGEKNALNSDISRIGGSQFSRTVGGVDRQNDFVNQASVGKYGNSDWYETMGNEITRNATRNMRSRVTNAAQRGGEYAQDATNALKLGYNQFATPSGVVQMRRNLQAAEDARLNLARETQTAAGWVGQGVAEIGTAFTQQPSGVVPLGKAEVQKDFSNYTSAILNKMTDRTKVIDKGIAALERQLKSSEKKLGL